MPSDHFGNRGNDRAHLVVCKLEAELLDTALDRVPAGQAVSDRDVAGETEVLRLEDLVCRGVVENSLGVNTGLVRERAVAGNRVHERHVDLDRLGNQVLDLTKHGKVVLALDVLGVCGIQASDKTTQGSNADTLANTEHRGVNVGRTGLECGICVGDGHTGVVVEVNLDVTRHDAPEGADELVHLARVRATNGVRDTDTVYANAVDRLVDGEEIDEV